jgi:hypothetical protein
MYEKKGLLGESQEQLIERLDKIQAEGHDLMEWLVEKAQEPSAYDTFNNPYYRVIEQLKEREE